MRASFPRRRHADDRGAVLPIVALMLFSLLAVTALVVDLGYARATRRSNQATVDLAAVAAGFNLSGGGSPGLVPSPRAACESAVESLRQNVSDLPAPVTMVPSCASLPQAVSLCDSGDPMQVLTSRNADPYDITIEYPVPDSEIARPEFDGVVGQPSRPSVGANDGLPCERMRVRLTRDNAPLFEGVLGGDGQTVTASATVRSSNAGDNTAIPALLLLERVDCETLQVSGNGGVAVRASTDVYGVIHSDTSGSVPPCTTNTNASGYAIYGTERPASQGGGPSIIAEGTATRPGRISIFSLIPGIDGRGGYYWGGDGNATNGLNVQPTPGRIISRTIVDDRYNSDENPAIAYIHADGHVLSTVAERNGFARNDAAAAAALDAFLTANYGGSNRCVARDEQCWAVITGPACSASNVVYQGRSQGVAGVGADNYFVHCAEFTGTNVVFRSGRYGETWPPNLKPLGSDLPYGRVVFSGKVDVSGTNSCTAIYTTYYRCQNYLAFPNADLVYVRGCVGCNGGNDFAVRSRSLLAMNHGENLILNGVRIGRPDLLAAGIAPTDWPWLDCTTWRKGAGQGGAWAETGVLATFGSKFTVDNGTVSLCQTAVYAGKNTTNHSPDQVTTGGNCSDARPCPTDDATDALVQINSGSALPVSWQGPNKIEGGPTPASPLDDLALWTEGGGDEGECVIAGQGAMLGGGIFFHPNCRMTYGGQTDNSNPINAQFIGRTLNVSGRGVLDLKPSVKDSIAVRLGGDVVLIR